MALDLEHARDPGSCPLCGGQLTATHMLTKSYELDGLGRWTRRIADFVEDIVVVCAQCGGEREGRFEASVDEFAFIALTNDGEKGVEPGDASERSTE